jgi:transcription termination/antitermination protein NusG
MAESSTKQWYVLRVASNKEDQVCEALTKKVQIENITDVIGRILVPTIKEKRVKAGNARVFQKKLYPGYVFVEMLINSDGTIPEKAWFVIKETMGVGDFIGSDNKPVPMGNQDVEKMLMVVETAKEQPSLTIDFKKGDQVKIREGPFENFEGQVEDVNSQKGMVKVIVTVFGRPTELELEYWQIEKG